MGAALALTLYGLQQRVYGPDEPSAWPLCGFALGVALTLGRQAPRALLPLALGLACSLPWIPTPVPLVGLSVALTAALAGAGTAGGLRGGLTGAAQLSAGATLGLALGQWLDPAVTGPAWLAVSGLACAGALRWSSFETPPTPTPDLPTWIAGAIGVRVTVQVAAGALVLAFLTPAAYTPAALALGLGLSVGLTLVAFFPALSHRWLAWGTEPLGWALIGVLLVSAPTQTAALTTALLTLGGLAAGLGLARPLARGGAVGLLAGSLGLALAPPLLAWAPARWSPAEAAGAALGLASAPEARAQIAESIERGDTVVRLTVAGPPTIQVVDVLGQRLLSRDGRPWTGGPVTSGGDWSYAAPALYRAALPLLLSPTPPQRVALAGLGTGVTAASLLAAEVRVTAIDGDPAAWRALRDPGELFGLANRRLLAPDTDWGDRLELRAEPSWPALRAGGSWDVVVLSTPDPSSGLLDLARRRGRVVVASLTPPVDRETPLRFGASPSLRVRLARFLSVFPDALAFWPGETAGVVLVGGLPQLSPRQATERWDRIRDAVGQVRGPLSSWPRLLGTCVADASGLRRFVQGDQDDSVPALASAGADPPPAVELPEDPATASRWLVALAEGAATRKLPAAAAWAAHAAQLDRSVHTVRLLGDLLYRAGDSDQAARLWREALDLDPAAIGPRLSLVTFHLNRSERDQARALLEEGLTRVPATPALNYALGELADQEGEHLLAARHFEAAEHFRDAPLRARQAIDRLRGSDHTLSLSQKVEAAALLLDRSRAERDVEQAIALRQESLERALAASNETLDEEPGAETRARLARVLGQLADGETLPLAKRNLHDHQARVLAPLPAPAQRLLRARALLGAGRHDAADRLLRELLRQDPNDAALLLIWAEVLEALEQPEPALEAYRRGLASKQRASSDASILEAVARLHLAQGRPEQSLGALEEAIDLAPGHPRLLRAQGHLLHQLGRRGEALTAWRAFLAVTDPADPSRTPIESKVKALEAELNR